ncbi:helicase associated domain-containing protein, partial [Streptomyces sp. t39]|uniref:helicase associated domain-containing protein n=1 Tax=Streptomyces sp. t39 TaxID=1828156 RepID=UPI0012D222AF
GLRAHDERAVEMLAIPQETSAAVSQASSWLGEAPESDGEEEQRLLLRFGTHRDPLLVARLVQYNVLEPETAAWNAGHRAAVAYRRREGHLAVPYNHVEGGIPGGEGAAGGSGAGFPLGRWLSDQRQAMRAGGILTPRAEKLEELGIVWDPADAAWEENLGAARAYYEAYATLAAPVTASIMDKPIGQWLANARKKHGLGKNPAEAARRAALLAAIDPDWRPDWPIDWQRSYAALKTALGPSGGEGGVLAFVEPGTLVHGVDVGRWLAVQKQDWQRLAPGQRERLEQLGVQPRPAAEKPAAARGKRAGAGASAAFDRGIAALAQYIEREGRTVVPRGWCEDLQDGTAIRLGVWLSNTRSRRAGLSEEQRSRLAALGIDWA